MTSPHPFFLYASRTCSAQQSEHLLGKGQQVNPLKQSGPKAGASAQHLGCKACKRACRPLPTTFKSHGGCCSAYLKKIGRCSAYRKQRAVRVCSFLKRARCSDQSWCSGTCGTHLRCDIRLSCQGHTAHPFDSTPHTWSCPSIVSAARSKCKPIPRPETAVLHPNTHLPPHMCCNTAPRQPPPHSNSRTLAQPKPCRLIFWWPARRASLPLSAVSQRRSAAACTHPQPHLGACPRWRPWCPGTAKSRASLGRWHRPGTRRAHTHTHTHQNPWFLRATKSRASFGRWRWPGTRRTHTPPVSMVSRGNQCTHTHTNQCVHDVWRAKGGQQTHWHEWFMQASASVQAVTHLSSSPTNGQEAWQRLILAQWRNSRNHMSPLSTDPLDYSPPAVPHKAFSLCLPASNHAPHRDSNNWGGHCIQQSSCCPRGQLAFRCNTRPATDTLRANQPCAHKAVTPPLH